MLKSKFKVLQIVFFDIIVIMMTKWVPEGQTINHSYYLKVLVTLWECVCNKWSELCKNRSKAEYCKNYQLYQFLFKAIFHIISIFGRVEPWSESTFLFQYIKIFQKLQPLEPLSSNDGEIEMCIHWVFNRKFNSQLLFETIFDIISIFGRFSPKVNLLSFSSTLFGKFIPKFLFHIAAILALPGLRFFPIATLMLLPKKNSAVCVRI